MPAKPSLVPPAERITGDLSEGADFISSIVAGLLIGLLLDAWLGIRPIMTVAWLLAGIGVGFWRLWRRSAELEDDAARRGYGA